VSNLKLSVLGNGAAVPTAYCNPSGQLLTFEGNQFLIDCGEGTQMQLLKHKIRYRKLENIFISHLHGDHYYGLIGLISTFHLYGREKPLTIYAPADLEELIKHQLQVSKTTLNYELRFMHLENYNDDPLFESDDFYIKSFPLKHSVPCWGFVFREKPLLRKINREFIENKKIPSEQIVKIKQGSDFVDSDGVTYLNSQITIAPRKSLSYAYCSDTAYDESITKHIKDVTLLYHEATFDNSMETVASEKLHSTASQAAQIAKNSNSLKLLLGHFSARFKDPKVLLDEARKVFPNTFLSIEGRTYLIENK